MILTSEKKSERLAEVKKMLSSDTLDWATARKIRSEEYARKKKNRSKMVIKWVNSHKDLLLKR